MARSSGEDVERHSSGRDSRDQHPRYRAEREDADEVVHLILRPRPIYPLAHVRPHEVPYRRRLNSPTIASAIGDLPLRVRAQSPGRLPLRPYSTMPSAQRTRRTPTLHRDQLTGMERPWMTRDTVFLDINRAFGRGFTERLWKHTRETAKIYPFMTYYVQEYFENEVAHDGVMRNEQAWLDFRRHVQTWESWCDVEILIRHDEIRAKVLEMEHVISEVEAEWVSSQWSRLSARALDCDIADFSNFVASLAASPDQAKILSLPTAKLSLVTSTLERLIERKSPEVRTFERFLRKIVKATGNLPGRLFLTGARPTWKIPITGGGFADVFRGDYDGKPVALKVLRIFQRGKVEFRKLHMDFCEEAMVWQRLDHPNVLGFYGVCEDEFAPRLAMVSPWMENGDLVAYLRMNPGVDHRAIVMGVAEGLLYLHNLKPQIVHGDLRAVNVLVDSDGCPRIADFGLARIVDSQASPEIGIYPNGKGSMRWQAPELLAASHFTGETGRVTAASDVYSFACVCLEIFTGEIPFSHLRDGAVVIAVVCKDQRPARPGEPALSLGLDDYLWYVMKECWATVPQKRLEMKEVVRRLRPHDIVVEDAEDEPCLFRNKGNPLLPTIRTPPPYFVASSARRRFEESAIAYAGGRPYSAVNY